MGVPRSEEEETLSNPAVDMESGQDREEASASGQSEFDQALASAEPEQAEETKTPVEDQSESVTFRPRRFLEENVRRVSEYQPVSSRSGTGGGGSNSVSVTLLTLDTELDLRSQSRQHFLPSPRTEREGSDMTDIRLIRDFQVRRKYGRRPDHVRPSASRDKSFIDLGLSGRRYFTNAKGTNDASLDSSRASKTPILGEQRSPQNTSMPTSVTARSRTDEVRDFARSGHGSLDSSLKDLQSPVPSFPPLSPGVPRVSVRSENSFYSSRHSGSPSLLVNHFGFSTIRPDTFSGIQRQRKLRLAASAENDDLIKELEQHAQRQILACQNMGFTHRGSRAAESVLSLKHTVSPSAFHAQSFFSRHMPREERTGTPGSLPEMEERRGRRVTHPAPGGKLSMPKLVMQDRQDQASRRATLPTVSGSSLQVILAQSNSK